MNLHIDSKLNYVWSCSYIDSMTDQDKDKLEQAIALLSSISGGTSSSTSASSSSLSNQARVEGNLELTHVYKTSCIARDRLKLWKRIHCHTVNILSDEFNMCKAKPFSNGRESNFWASRITIINLSLIKGSCISQNRTILGIPVLYDVPLQLYW